MDSVPEKGGLGETPLPRLLLALGSARFEGTLRLERDHLEKSFRFQRGAPISAESNLASETLGVQLLDSGRITRDDHHRVSAYVTERGVKEGVALLELGLIEPKGLFLALKEQVRARLVDCFAWPRGDFECTREAEAPEGAQPFRADLYPLIQEGVETHWSPERVLGDLAPHMDETVTRNRLLSRIQDRLRWDDSVGDLLDAFDGTRTLWRAIQFAKTPRAMAAAWLVDAIGALDYRATDANHDDSEAASDESAVLSVEPDIEIVLSDEISAPVHPRATPSTPRASADDDAKLERDETLSLEISQKYVALDELDYYALLGIEQSANSGEVKHAYLDAAKRFHPDTLARAGLEREDREKAGQVFAAIGKAHAVLSDAKRRSRYDGSLDSDDTDLDAERLAAAETNYRKGEVMMRQGNFRAALDFLRPAVELWPEDGTYQAALGWSLFKASPSNPVAARQHLERAYELEPRNAQVAYHLSLVLKSLGEGAPAANLLQKAREIDPDIG